MLNTILFAADAGFETTPRSCLNGSNPSKASGDFLASGKLATLWDRNSSISSMGNEFRYRKNFFNDCFVNFFDNFI